MRRPVPAASLRCQIADEIIALNWHHPTARPFHNDVFDPVLKRMKGSEDMIDINIYFLHQATNYGCRRRFQPNRIDVVDCQAVTTSGQQELRISTVSATDRFHPGTGRARCLQQVQKPRGGVRLAHTRVRPGDEETHATCFTGSDFSVARFALIVSTIDRKIFAPSMLPSRASDARSGCGMSPNTFRSRLQIPAMFSIEPFGFASGTTTPRLSA